MKIADLGSRGVWFPAQKMSLDVATMANIMGNYMFSLDSFASHLNCIVPRYYSQAFEPKAVGRNFFEQEVNLAEFIWFFLPPRIFWNLGLHLRNCNARGVGCFQVWPALPTYSLFACDGHRELGAKYIRICVSIPSFLNLI